MRPPAGKVPRIRLHCTRCGEEWFFGGTCDTCYSREMLLQTISLVASIVVVAALIFLFVWVFH